MPTPLTSFVGRIKGIFNGGSTQRCFLPWNDLVRTYNLDTRSLFRISVSAYKPNKIEMNGAQVTTPINEPNPIWNCEFLYNEDALTVSHQQNYGDIGGVAGLVKGVLFDKGVYGITGLELLRNVQTVDNILKGKTQGLAQQIRPFRTEWNDFQANDTAKSYKGTSNPQNFTASFILFSNTDPFIDVVIPSIIFSYLSYPTYDRDKSVGLLKEIAASIENPSENSPFYVKSDDPEFAKTAKEISKDFLNIISSGSSSVMKDRWRIRMGDPPPYWKVASSNGIIFLNNAHISDVDITYHGPWLKRGEKSSNAGSLISQALGAAQGGGSGLSPNEVMDSQVNVLTGKSSISELLGGMNDKNNLSGFPSYAEIKISFVSNFNQVFGEELFSGLVGASAMFKGKDITTGMKTNILKGKV